MGNISIQLQNKISVLKKINTVNIPVDYKLVEIGLQKFI